MSENLKAWCHWNKVSGTASEDDLEMVSDIENIIEENKIAKEISRNLANYNMDLVEENKKLRTTIELFIAKNIENEEKIAWMDDLRNCLKELDGEES